MGERPVLTIDPRRGFGQVCVDGTRIPAEVIGGMIAAGESVASVADDYGITRDQALVCCWWYANECAGSRRKWEQRVALAWNAWRCEAAAILGGHKLGPLPDPPDIGENAS